jgi:serine/threonine protein kinase
MIGTRLTHYEITSHLGSGGMGEVYQANDSKLGRNVAIKLLPEAFSHDSERVARFEREARVLASLNHPNIAAIHGLEESGGRKFLVMELVDGETLAERIKRGSIPVAEALPIARQIAEALEAAHDSEKGIIHRDLKPANVKITPDGKVKVLDFGLAKAFVGETAKADLSNSPTLSNAATNGGMILGTAAYMSPEQAKGAAVDRRTDIFAFGCVLYEMLTARQAFHGDTLAETLAAVLKAEPDWSRLPKDTPPSVRRLLRRCLQKDRSWRLQTAGDARIEISDGGTETDVVNVPGAVRHPWRERIAWIAGLAIAIAVAVFFAMSRPAATSTGDLTRFNIYAPEKTVFGGITIATVSVPEFALSPDARSIVFAAGAPGVKPMLWLRSMEDLAERPLPGTENGEFSVLVARRPMDRLFCR